MASTFLNLSTDTTLGGNSPSDSVAVSQKAIKTYVDNNSGGSYTEGTGIDITNDVISVDSTVVTTNTAQTITSQKTIVGQTILKASSSTSSGANTVSGFEFQNSSGTFVGRMTSTDSNGLAIHSPYDIQLRAHTKASGSIIGSNGLACTSTGVTPASAPSSTPYDLGSSLVRWSNLYLDTTIYAGSNNYAISLPTKAGTMALTNDISNATITFTQGGTTKGTITLNQSGDQTIALDAGGGGSSYTAGTAIDITSDVISVKYDNSTITVNASGQLQAAMEAFTAAEVQTIWESV